MLELKTRSFDGMTMPNFLWVATISLLLVWSNPLAAGTVRNLQSASTAIVVTDDGRLAFVTDESRQGGTDLNNDGDSTDSVLQLVQLPDGAVPGDGIVAVSGVVLAGDGFLLFAVDESAEGNTDLNADGDTDDNVAHVFDLTDDTLTNLGYSVGSLDVVGTTGAFEVDESKQTAAGIDLNGDLDTDDDVLFVYDHTKAGTPESIRNVGLSTDWGGFLAGAQHASAVVNEADQQQDLNGDLDLLDNVLMLHDVVANTTTAVSVANSWTSEQDTLTFNIPEAAVGLDLNGDSDMSDRVLHYYKLSTGVVHNLEVAPSFWKAEGDWLILTLKESQDSVDYNGDGDEVDTIAQTVNTGGDLPVVTRIDLAMNGFAITDGSRLLFRVDEAAEGAAGTDLNRDGDMLDAVLHSCVNLCVAPVNHGIATEPIPTGFDGGVALFLVDESSVGPSGMDLNGDGDIADKVVHAIDLIGNTLTSLGISAVQFPRFASGIGAFPVAEIQENGTVLNGDGDATDHVMHVYEHSDGSLENLALAVSGSGNPVIADGYIAFQSRESNQGEDLNGDLDTVDNVIHIWSRDGTGEPDLRPVSVRAEALRASSIGVVIDLCVTVENAGSGDAGRFAVEMQGFGATRRVFAAGLSAGQTSEYCRQRYLRRPEPADLTSLLRVDVDPDLVVEESNEGNNFRSVLTTVSLPDYEPISVEAQTDGLHLTIRNNGTAAWNQSFAAEVQIGSVTLRVSNISAIPAGQTTVVVFGRNALPVGTFDAVFTVNSGNASVLESNAGNNTLEQTVTISYVLSFPEPIYAF